LSINSVPKRGEIWLANFDPTVGSEIRKIRPAVVISSDAVGKLPVKLVAPITDWKDYFAQNLWHVRINPDSSITWQRFLPWTYYSCEGWIFNA
jgi:mRNA interferase MazF